MASTQHTIQTTYAESPLDPRMYVSMLHSGEYPDEISHTISTWVQDQMHNIFKNGYNMCTLNRTLLVIPYLDVELDGVHIKGNLRGRKILDVGTGPVVFPIITASKWFDEVYLSDISKPCLEILEKWQRGDSDHMRPLMESFVAKDGEGEMWETKNRQVLEKIKGILEFDVNRPNLSDIVLKESKFDVITSCFCLSGANLSIAAFVKALNNISDLLVPGGHLVVCDLVDQSFFQCGNVKFHKFSSTTEELQNAYKDSGFVIQMWDSYTFEPKLFYSDGSTIYSVVARKQ